MHETSELCLVHNTEQVNLEKIVNCIGKLPVVRLAQSLGPIESIFCKKKLVLSNVLKLPKTDYFHRNG